MLDKNKVVSKQVCRSNGCKNGLRIIKINY